MRLGPGNRFRRRFGPLACGGQTWLGRRLGRRRGRCALPGRRRSRLTRPRIRPRPSSAELRDIVRGRHRPGGNGLRVAAYRGNGRNEAREDAARRVVRLVGNPPHGARQPAARRLGGWRAPPTMRSHLDVRDGAPPSRRPQRHTSGRHDDDGARATQRSANPYRLRQRGREAARRRRNAADASRSTPVRWRSGLPQPPHDLAAEAQFRGRVVRPARHASPKVVLLKPWWAISSSSSSCVR